MKRLFPVFFLFVFLICCAAGLLAGEEDSVSVKAEVDKAFLTIGEPLRYRVSVTRDPSIEIVSQIVPPSSDVFELKEARDFSEKQGRQVVEGRQFVLTTYELGEFILEPVSVRYRTPAGIERTLQTNRLFITVQSVDTSGKPKTDIRDLKGTLELSRSWLGLAFLLLIAFGGGYFLWRHFHREEEREKAPSEPALSLEDRTLQQLNALFDSDLIRRGKVKEYFLELSEILRRYFEGRFEILAVESTTSEILLALKVKEVTLPLQEKIRETLEAADLVKFAKWKPTVPEILRINQLSKTIVEEARPKTNVMVPLEGLATNGV